jgi:2-isopropylmalate synthase
MSNTVSIYDTTLRDGTQGEGVNFSWNDKLRVARKLDQLGVDYIEGGWPGSNPKDIEFFQRAQLELELTHARLAAFGSTCKANTAAADDPQIQLLLDAGTPVVTIFGKTWDLHVHEVLRTTLHENVRMIADSVAYLKSHGKEVVYDAEHFFDGYNANPEYALSTLAAALDAGADALVLCDTNGGRMPWEIEEAVTTVRNRFTAVGTTCVLGIHAHNDSGVGVANSLAAVRAGCTHVQGTINGYGERCGNANLISILPDLELKMGHSCLPAGHLRMLTEVSNFVSELANLVPDHRQPFVGLSAFAHKGGTHVNAVVKCEQSYQHIEPTLVGNQKRILVSELSGKDNIAVKRIEFGLHGLDREQERQVLARIKEMENQGYSFEGAEGSVELMLRRTQPGYQPPFALERYKVVVEHRHAGPGAHRGGTNGGSAREGAGPDLPFDPDLVAEATLKVRVGSHVLHTAAEGNGPVNALDQALRKALLPLYPQLADVHLTDYKVRILDSESATAAQVRVQIDSSDGQRTWSTVGADPNIIEASWHALADSVEYALWTVEEPVATQ